VKVRLGLLALASGALALGMLAPGAVSATPPASKTSAEKPSGKAMINIEGGTAYAKKKSKGVYRVVLPQGAEINWMGQVTGKGTRVGTFRPKAFVAGWTRMGHREGTFASTTLTWKAPGADVDTFQQVTVDAPRINSAGQMTFVVTTVGKVALPAKMDNFSLNIGIASEPAPRAFTVFGPYIWFDGTNTAFVYANATDVSAGWVYFALGTPDKLCKQGGYALAGSATVKITTAFACGNFTVNTTQKDGTSQSTLSMAPPAPGSSSDTQGAINGAFSVTPTGQPSGIFNIKQTLMTYTKGGGAPANSGSTPS
jgi:hypothetical protein